MQVTPSTDLAPFVGARVRIAGFRYCRVQTIRHGGTANATCLRGGVWGDMYEEPRGGDARGGNTAFYFDYGTDFELAEER
jgi:hypothetical protein